MSLGRLEIFTFFLSFFLPFSIPPPPPPPPVLILYILILFFTYLFFVLYIGWSGITADYIHKIVQVSAMK